MPIEELLKRYAVCDSDGHVSDVPSGGRKNLRSSSAHKGCIQHISTFSLPRA